MSSRHSDRVVLNVGGTRFATSVTTLASSSDYFERLFSKDWSGTSDHNDGDNEFFVDQDPGPFAVLLSYMRLGHIKAVELTPVVLLQAQFFGMEKLLAAVRAEAARSKALRSAAISVGMLKAEEPQKEYAMLAIIDPNVLGFELHRLSLLEFVVDVYVGTFPHVGSDSSQENNGPFPRFVPDCRTFLDGLNWLNRNGYTTFEEEMTNREVDASQFESGRLYFSKLVREETESSMRNVIIYENCQPTHGPREFAIWTQFHEESYVENCLHADIGQSVEMNVNNGPHPGVARVRISTVPDVRDHQEAMNWLQRNGFTRREKELENVFVQAVAPFFCVIRGSPLRQGTDMDISVWSRPFEASK